MAAVFVVTFVANDDLAVVAMVNGAVVDGIAGFQWLLLSMLLLMVLLVVVVAAAVGGGVANRIAVIAIALLMGVGC